MTPEELKAFGQSIKTLPMGERKAAGIKFQTANAKVGTKESQSKKEV